jgi:integrase/recombinase XerC
MSLRNHFSVKSFLDHLKFEKRYSAHTLLSYENDLGSFFSFLHSSFGDVTLAGVDHNHIRSWLASLKEKGMASRSLNRKISALRSFFKYGMKLGELDHSPMVKVTGPKISRTLPHFVREEEASLLLAAAASASEDWRSLNAQMIITLFYSTGMRLSELIQLKETQVDYSRKQIKVLGKGNKERLIPVSEEILRSIKDYVKQKQEWKARLEKCPDDIGHYLLVTDKGARLYPKYAYRVVHEWLGKATTLSKKSPHVLRHTFATHLMNNGANLNAVKELLGHSSLASTQVYTHTTIEKLRNIHRKSHPKG